MAALKFDDNQRTALAVLLCILVFLFYSQRFMSPYRAPAAGTPSSATQSVPSATGTQANVAHPATPIDIAGASTGAATSASSNAAPSPAAIKAAPVIKITSPKISATVTTLGARFSSLTLLDYKENLGENAPYEMVHSGESGPLPLGVYVGDQSDANVQYSVANSNQAADNEGVYHVPADGELAITLRGTFSGGTTIEKTIHFIDATYHIDVEVRLSNAINEGAKIWLEWNHLLPIDQPRYNKKNFILLDQNNKLRHVQPKEVVEGSSDAGDNKWVALSDTYFISAIIPAEKGVNTRLGKVGETFSMRAAGSDRQGHFSLYVGPKSFKNLEAMGAELQRSVDLGMFSFLAYPLLLAIHWFYLLLGNYGLAIILLTLSIKTLFLPLTKASISSMQAMQELQPEIKALRERIKDATQLNQEMMALYRRRGVNPMGGCLPMLIQLPVFLGLYNALLNAIELRHAPFALWITDLSAPEKLQIFGMGIPIMVIIMGASMILQQWMTPSAADPEQKKAMMLMPFVFTGMFVIFPMPAGLVLYWLVNNTISIIQQFYLRNDKRASPLTATLLGSAIIFCVGFVLTLL